MKSAWRWLRRNLLNAYVFLFGGAGLLFVQPGTSPKIFGVIVLIVYALLVVDTQRVVFWSRGPALAGLSMVVPVAPLRPGVLVDTNKASERARIGVAALCTAVHGATEINLMLASGFRVIGWEGHQGWLYSELSQATNSRLRIMLLDPAGKGAVDRADQLMRPHGHDAYSAGTMAVLSTLKRWKFELHRDISVWLYAEPPIWQMIQVPKELWVLSAAGPTATDYSPMYAFRRDRAYSLAYGLEAVWERRFSLETTKSLDWDDVVAPDPAHVIAMPGVPWS